MCLLLLLMDYSLCMLFVGCPLKNLEKLANSHENRFCSGNKTDSIEIRCYKYLNNLLPDFFPIPPQKIYLTSVSSKSSSLRNAMNACPCCSAQLLRHVRYKSIYWFCSRCRQEMPVMESLRTNLHQKLQTSKPINKISYKKVLVTAIKH